MVNDAIDQLASLLSFCGFGENVHNAQSIRKHATEKFKTLFATARKLSKMIGESIVSDDLEVAIFDGGCLFDREHMEGAFAGGRAKPGQCVVVCTTGLGLCERKSMGQRMVLKPKVLLRDV